MGVLPPLLGLLLPHEWCLHAVCWGNDLMGKVVMELKFAFK